MASYRLRAATGGDVAAIADVWHRGWLDGHAGHVPDQLERYRRASDFRRRVPDRVDATTVAVAGSQVVGFVTVHEDEVEQLYVDRPARGTGVAAALLSHAEQAIAQRFQVAWLAVVAGNVRACRFYSRQGWQEVAAFDYPAEIDGGTLPVPALRYEKHLLPA